MKCSFDEEITLPGGTYQRSTCINKAEILLINDPCYGLCFVCAYRKLKEENKRLREALEHILEYWNRDENPRAMSDALWYIIETAEQALKDKDV